MLSFTDRAQSQLRAFMEQHYSDEPALRIELAGGSPLAPEYEFSLVEASDRELNDVVVDADGIKVLLDRRSAAVIEGATIDFVERGGVSGFEIRNGQPEAHAAPAGPLAERVRTVIDTRINPAVAMHGGHIALVDVQDSVVFLQMSGGCQGCGMAQVTLKQGVERMIKDAVPEVTEIRDVTDHAAGANPYFQPSK
jgi:Fe/S biogenesis protein NfuA